MDTNEHYDDQNQITKLHIEGLTPYTESLKHSESGRRLENSPSPWKETLIQKLKRLSESGSESGCLERLGRDTLLRALSLLDIRSLTRSMCVNRGLNKTIRSAELRRLWSEENQSPVVLLSSYTLPCKLLLPSSSIPPEVFWPLTGMKQVAAGATLENPLLAIVASHRGLVCVRFKESISEDCGLDLAIGNPLTREWVALPRSLQFGHIGNYRFTMEVAENQGLVHFKVAGFSVTGQSYRYHIFDSATDNWSITTLEFPPRTAFKWSAFDLRSGAWQTEVIRSWSITTGLERSAGEVHRLSHPRLNDFSTWEYKGSTYFASVWSVEQERYHSAHDAAGEFAGYGVWKVPRGTASGELLETVAAVWARDVGVKFEAILWNNFGGCENYVADCTGEGNLVCFGGASDQSPTMPLLVYDIVTGRWTLFDEQHPALGTPSDLPFSGSHYAAAVVYTPSLLVAPQKLNSRLS